MNVDVTTTVDRTVRRAAVLGSPIEHSLSPVLHGAAYQALDLQGWHYDKIECDEPGLPRMVDGMGPEWAGWGKHQRIRGPDGLGQRRYLIRDGQGHPL